MDIQIDSHTLRKITNNFSDDQKVGSGLYGDVYKAVYRREVVEVKLLDTREGVDDEQYKNELRNHMKVQHPNIVRLVGYCNEDTKKYIEPKDGESDFGKQIYRVLCFEYIPGGSLHKHISENSLGDDWHTHYNIIKGICDGLLHLHCERESPILHLDLNPVNILLDKSMVPKLANFGLSRICSASRSNLVVDSVAEATKYMAPELKSGGQLSEMIDIFSLGVTIIDVIKGFHDFGHCSDKGATKFVENVCGYWMKKDRTAHLDQVETCTKIALRCVDPDSRERPTIKEIVENLHNMETQLLSQGAQALGLDSSSGKFSSIPLPDKLAPSSSSGRGPLDVVIVYAFDCTDYTPAWYTVDDGVFWLVQEKLTHFDDSCIGYIYPMLSDNTYTSDMKLVDSADTKTTGYTAFAWRRMACKKNMASGLAEAHKMIGNRGYQNGIILFFSDGLVSKGDFFDGAETFVSTVPVHTFTLGGDAFNQGLQDIAVNSPGGKFHTVPIPERPNLSGHFSKLLDSILGGTTLDFEKPPIPSSAREPLDVVIVYAFDCTDCTPAWCTVEDVFWLVQEKLTHYVDSCMGYIYPMLSNNTYTSDMKLVDSADTKIAGYKAFSRRRMSCKEKMASGLAEAHKMISNRGYQNGIILFFSDGLINKGDFFDGTENFVSTVPVHTFTLDGYAYNQGLKAIAENSPGGKFHTTPVPERPRLSLTFSKLLDSLLEGDMMMD
ncbi:hypothetical protein BS78_K280100 [Paspalum vaginatum]|uniref:Protein kinase domain-containing protein n=1 Tax=Paspalum vaginatum TaxID=158149 RepID=A0A9W7XAS0_9POAL|nr:hypothetical protein BS78_K280100 [Paspalum vaginatum]KAJ1255213.1 hypothetical protein BS78_K280100 [Paspalum vaginatum]